MVIYLEATSTGYVVKKTEVLRLSQIVPKTDLVSSTRAVSEKLSAWITSIKYFISIASKCYEDLPPMSGMVVDNTCYQLVVKPSRGISGWPTVMICGLKGGSGTLKMVKRLLYNKTLTVEKACSMFELSPEYIQKNCTSIPLGIVSSRLELNPLTSSSGQIQMWPTSTKEDYRSGPNSKQQGLPEKVAMWPTPVQGQQELKNWPTPTRNDTAANRDIVQQAKRNSLGLAEVVRCYPEGEVGKWSPIEEEAVHKAIKGQLNPTWVEWLMGFPLSWSRADPHTHWGAINAID